LTAVLGRCLPATLDMPVRLLPSSSSDDSASLVRRIRAGDPVAFEALFRDMAPRLIDFTIRYVGSVSAAEDIVQDVFVDVWERRRKLVIETTINAYLHAAVRNRAINYVRRESRHTDLTDDTIVANVPSALQELEAQEINERIVAAIDTLPPRRRIVLLLRLDEEMSYAEIAESMGISIRTVENQLAKAWAMLHDLLADLKS
jgi:RNA polymerase sigma-70 factor, ECF subfamily